MRAGSFLRFLFSAADQARIDARSIQVEDIPHAAAPTAHSPYPQSMRLTFRVTDPANGPLQIRPLFPGSLMFIPDEPGHGPDPASIDFTDTAFDAAYRTWKTVGTVMVNALTKDVLRGMEAQAPELHLKPNGVWYSPVQISKSFLLDTLRTSGFR